MNFLHGLLNTVEKTTNLIPVLALKHLLSELQSKRPDICFRYRLLGEMWVSSAMRVMHVEGKGAILNDELHDKLVNLSDISLIMQFELDAPFMGFQPHYHYDVKPVPEFS